jgi:hypothetical protein
MKKIIPLLMTIALVFVSCETEPLNGNDLNSVEAKGGIKKVKPEKSDDCEVDLTPDLPGTVYACADAKPGSEAYFDLSIADGPLAGDYGAWCVDVENTLNAPHCFDADVYSSYGTLPAGAVDNPDNFDLINWILNQYFVGKNSDGGAGDPYTLGDVQWAMWELIDDANCAACTYLDPYDEVRANEIVALALANGEGYEPGAGDVLAVVLVPQTGEQVVIIPYPLECEPEGGCETAFARDTGGANCFLDNGFSRWGWSLEISGFSVTTYDIYAGAGQCDISKGALVGTVTVDYSSNGVEVTYDIDSSYTVSETHTYAGTAMFPTKNGDDTVAPGQYTIEDGLTTGDPIYVIAHAVVCGD